MGARLVFTIVLAFPGQSDQNCSMSVAVPTAGIGALNRQRLLVLMGDRLPEILRRFGVRHLRLFGSAARDELRDDSDVDVLVEFTAPATFQQYMGLKFYLEDLLNRQVDLVTTKGLRKEFRPMVERESVVVG
jgi:predicted nucleotidyltransferase